MADIEDAINDIWARHGDLQGADAERALKAACEAIARLDRGELRVAQLVDGQIVVHEWLKRAILLYFQLAAIETSDAGPIEHRDKVPLKRDFASQGVRAAPGAIARWGSFLAPGVVLMPSFVNIGARVGTNTMVDTWATVGSCAQIGGDVHLAGGVGIGGVLEPAQAAPVVIEPECLVGSRSMVIQGARVGRGSVSERA
jgi:2,3,4,5-tetrahydropyridine-2-carboxylate N-succinyltransferase